MSKMWAGIREWWMYWRFRNITRNRLRLNAWWSSRRPVRSGPRSTLGPGAYRPRASATALRYGGGTSVRRTWIVLLIMVALLTALSVWANSTVIPPALVTGIGALIVAGAAYWAMRGV